MKHKLSIIVAALLIFVLALGITLYPLISNYVNQKYASTIYTKYEEMIQNVDETELQEARSLAQSYNQALAPVSSYDKEGISEASHNYDSLLNLGGNGIMGYIEIPCIQVNLPIYHGTDTETLERGVGHLLGSSLPVGGSSTHAVLSGHSGMAGQKMFTDLLQMKTGDIFYLHVLGETLAYEVDSLNTVPMTPACWALQAVLIYVRLSPVRRLQSIPTGFWLPVTGFPLKLQRKWWRKPSRRIPKLNPLGNRNICGGCISPSRLF